MNHTDLIQRFPALDACFSAFPTPLRGAFTLRELPTGYIIHQKDTLLEEVGILCDGTLKVINEFDTGNAYMIEYDRAVDFIGDVTVLAGKENTSVTIETFTPCTVVFFARTDFEYWLDNDPAFLRMVAQRVACKLYQSSYHHGKELFYSSPRLMLEFLCAATQGAFEEVRLPDTRQQLSEQLGMSPKTVDRTISRLKELGLISTERGKICISPAQQVQMRTRLAGWIE